MTAAAARPGDQARVTVSVAVPPDEAWRIFTTEIDLWWRRGRRFRSAPGERGLVALEPGIGGRVFESFATDAGEQVVEIGRIREWQPPERLLFDWRAVSFAPHEWTEVEVSFQRTPGGTRVTVVHRGWSAIRADHPVRHGLDSAGFLRMMGLWWGDLLSSLRLQAAARRPPVD